MTKPAEIAESVVEIGVDEAFALLGRDAAAVLVDVRTNAEWTYVGIPDLSSLGKEPIFIEWQQYPRMAVAGDFVATLTSRLEERGVARDAPVLFLCRSGVRSLAAAQALAAAGFTHCLNVMAGFEGPPDPTRHRGRVAGWKAKGYPWTQS